MKRLLVLFMFLAASSSAQTTQEEMPQDIFVAYLVDGWNQPPSTGMVARVTHTVETDPFLSETGHDMTECAIHYEWISYPDEIPLDWDNNQKILIGEDFVSGYAAEDVLFGHPAGCQTIRLSG